MLVAMFNVWLSNFNSIFFFRDLCYSCVYLSNSFLSNMLSSAHVLHLFLLITKRTILVYIFFMLILETCVCVDEHESFKHLHGFVVHTYQECTLAFVFVSLSSQPWVSFYFKKSLKKNYIPTTSTMLYKKITDDSLISKKDRGTHRSIH